MTQGDHGPLTFRRRLADAHGERVVSGRDEVAQARGNASAVFEWWRHELHELFDCGGSVVAAVSFHARSRTSGVEVVQEEVHTWTMRDGRVARFEWGRDLQAALKAAGLRK